LFPFRQYCEAHPHLASLLPQFQIAHTQEDAEEIRLDNLFTAPSYRVVHFVVDMPVRVPQEVMDHAPPAAWALGRVIFGQTEFQIIDRETEQSNEMGEASHEAYKWRQQQAVARRLKVGVRPAAPRTAPEQDQPVRRRRRQTKRP